MTYQQYWVRTKNDLIHRLRSIVKQLKKEIPDERRRYLEARKQYHLQRFLDLKALIKRENKKPDPPKEVENAQGNIQPEADRAEVLRESQQA